MSENNKQLPRIFKSEAEKEEYILADNKLKSQDQRYGFDRIKARSAEIMFLLIEMKDTIYPFIEQIKESNGSLNLNNTQEFVSAIKHSYRCIRTTEVLLGDLFRETLNLEEILESEKKLGD